uniref:Small-subunit processome Utp21 domain-containing protein n=1 Tax=Ditylum brightwellii TaxID=49249 RepID=A0A7S1YSC3_9STRA
MGITVAVHGVSNVALYKRTAVLSSLDLFHSANKSAANKVVQMLSLGKTKLEMVEQEKEGNLENVLILALLSANTFSKLKSHEDHDNVQTVGQDSDDDDDDDNDTSDDDDDSDNDQVYNSNQVIILFATRTSLILHKRITLPSNFTPTISLHPSTYVNKMLIGGTQNTLHLLNVNTTKLIHTFTSLQSSSLSSSSTVTALEQSPAVDTIAVGTSLGKVHLLNLKHDVLLFTLMHHPTLCKEIPLQVTSMSFRTDATAMKYNIAPLAVGTDDGSISIWDLTNRSDNDDAISKQNEDRRVLLCKLDTVHPGGISRLDYLPNEPLLLSTGTASNSIQMHLFDNPNHTPSLLRSRAGHTAPPKYIRYLHPNNSFLLSNMMDGTDASSCQILSAAGNPNTDTSLRVFSTARSILDKEYSQGKGLLQRANQLGIRKTDLLLPPITAWATSQRHVSSSSAAKQSDWGDLVTIHSNHALAYVWNTSRGSQCGPVLRQSNWPISAMKKSLISPRHYATSVCLSACGYFALVGTKGGVVYKYNIQSGLPRGSYPRNASAISEEEEEERNKKNMKIAGNIERTRTMLEKSMKIDQHNHASSARKEEDDDEDDEEETKYAKQKRRHLKLTKLARHDTNSSITGVAVDALNNTLITIGSTDSKIICWDFTSHGPKRMPFQLAASPTKLQYIRDSNLCAIALDDRSVVLFDVVSYAIVRRFTNGHTGRITDIALDGDGRRLYTASLDKTIRIWDVPTNSCVDWLAFDHAPMSMSVSPTGEFLATAHENTIGINLWADKSFFRTVYLDGSSPPKKPIKMDDPVPVAEVLMSGGKESSREEEEKEESEKRYFENQALKRMDYSMRHKNKNGDYEMEEEEGNEDDDNGGLPRVLAKAKEKGLVTLSGLPPGHWKNLFHLELVKERNKPKEPPKKPEKAPFFLQWRGSTDNSTIGMEEEGGGTNLSSTDVEGGVGGGGENDKNTKKDTAEDEDDEDEWNAAWSDDDDNKENDGSEGVDATKEISLTKRSVSEDEEEDMKGMKDKRRKVTHHRSHLAALLRQCAGSLSSSSLLLSSDTFEAVTKHLSTLGPSAIDVAFSTLCHGSHDLDEGLELLHLASLWLLEEIRNRKNYDSVNAYLHRFLYLHSSVLSGIDEALLIENEERGKVKAAVKANENKELEDDRGGGHQRKKKDVLALLGGGGGGDNIAIVDDEEPQKRHKRRSERMELLQTIGELKKAQRDASECLRGKMQNALCLLKHFSRMV